MSAVVDMTKPEARQRFGLLAHPGMRTHPAMVDETLPLDGGDEQEVWRPVPSLPNYEASSLGRIRTLDRWETFTGQRGTITRFRPGRVRRLFKIKHKTVFYWMFGIPGSSCTAHIAVCEAFHGPKPSPTHQVAHIDGDGLNNRPWNLAWKTPRENDADKDIHGTRQRGAKHGMAKVGDADIVPIFEAIASGETVNDVAARYGVAKTTISAIINRKNWPHIYVDFFLIKDAQSQAKKNSKAAAARASAARWARDRRK